MLDENLLNVARRTALERAAYLLLHLFTRLEEIGSTKGNTVAFPFTQQHVADTLGMSLVHTNKTLKRLSATKSVRWKDKIFEGAGPRGARRPRRFTNIRRSAPGVRSSERRACRIGRHPRPTRLA